MKIDLHKVKAVEELYRIGPYTPGVIGRMVGLDLDKVKAVIDQIPNIADTPESIQQKVEGLINGVTLQGAEKSKDQIFTQYIKNCIETFKILDALNS